MSGNEMQGGKKRDSFRKKSLTATVCAVMDRKKAIVCNQTHTYKTNRKSQVLEERISWRTE